MFKIILLFIVSTVCQEIVPHKHLNIECLKNKNKGNTGNYGKWNCPIPYKFDAGTKDQPKIIDAMDYIEEMTGWSFVEQTNEQDYLNFVDSPGCASYLGKIGGEQEVFVSEYCDTGAVVHELSHAIGLNHEQSRSDRDDYVKINLDNVDQNSQNNFEKYTNSVNVGEYDFNSLMHYGLSDFSNNGENVIEPIVDTEDVCFIGQRYELSKSDVDILNTLFKGEPCNTISERKCNVDSRKLCGSSEYSLFYQEYFPMGKKNNRIYYRTRWGFLTNYFYLYYFDNKWILSPNLDESSYYAFVRSDVMDPVNITNNWNVNFGKISGIIANECVPIDPETESTEPETSGKYVDTNLFTVLFMSIVVVQLI